MCLGCLQITTFYIIKSSATQVVQKCMLCPWLWTRSDEPFPSPTLTFTRSKLRSNKKFESQANSELLQNIFFPWHFFFKCMKLNTFNKFFFFFPNYDSLHNLLIYISTSYCTCIVSLRYRQVTIFFFHCSNILDHVITFMFCLGKFLFPWSYWPNVYRGMEKQTQRHDAETMKRKTFWGIQERPHRILASQNTSKSYWAKNKGFSLKGDSKQE